MAAKASGSINVRDVSLSADYRKLSSVHGLFESVMETSVHNDRGQTVSTHVAVKVSF